MSKAICFGIPDDLASRPSEIAEEKERPESFSIQKARQAYLAETEGLEVALDRLHDSSDPVVGVGDRRKELEPLNRIQESSPA